MSSLPISPSTLVSFILSALLIGGTIWLFRSSPSISSSGAKGKKKRQALKSKVGAKGKGGGSGIGAFDNIFEAEDAAGSESGVEGKKKKEKKEKKEKRPPSPLPAPQIIAPASSTPQTTAATTRKAPKKASSSRDPTSDMLLSVSYSDDDESPSSTASKSGPSPKASVKGKKGKKATSPSTTLQVPAAGPATAASKVEGTSSAGEWDGTEEETEGGWSKVPDRKTRTPTPTPGLTSSASASEIRSSIPGLPVEQTKKQRQNAAKREAEKERKAAAEEERVKTLKQHRAARAKEESKPVPRSVPGLSGGSKEVSGGMKAQVDSESGLLIWD